MSSHINGTQSSVLGSDAENQILRSIREELNFGYGAPVHAWNTAHRLTRVDVPHHHVARAVSGNAERIYPIELYDRVFVPVKQALQTFH